jgi:serine/threonine-protein kinase HipA
VQVLPDALAENSARLIEPSRGFAFALSGAQFKLVARQNRADRLTIPATGQGGQWIAKFSAPALPELVENEWTLLSWARACALDVPEFELRHSDEFEDPHGVIAAGFRGPVLLVRRFDRNGEERIHQEDFAQVLSLEPEQKYDAEVDETVHYTTIGNIVRAHCGPSDAEEYVRRLVFMLLSGNCDAHTKNWTLLYRSPRRPSLSPLYDAVCTVAYPEFHQRQLALALSSELRLDCVKRAHVIELCARIGLAPGRADEVISSFVPRARAAWASVRSDQRAPARVRRAIDENLSLLAARGL